MLPFFVLVDILTLSFLDIVDGSWLPLFMAAEVVNVVSFSITSTLLTDRHLVDFTDLVEVV